ncbi:hypothetical protein KPL70_017039 [Citrus sinensis]|nr:hypothetical protein KPL70_017039 [Citrus sinensis]
MANQGAKKRKEENARHMEKLRRLIIACNVIYFVVRMIIFHSTFTWKHWVGLVLTSVAYAIPYQQLSAMAKPTYTDDGELIDGGFDMSTGGICGYQHLERTNPLVSLKDFCRKGDTEDEKTRKKREKMEKKTSRGKFVKTRTR